MPHGPSRRELVKGGLAAAAVGSLAACGGSGPASSKPPAPKPTAARKRILILGGTGFIGPKMIDAALARGHTITTFNRGKREKIQPLERDVERLYGNRDPDLPADDERGPDGKLLHPDATPRGLEQLVGRKWDVVIDNSGFFPRIVEASAKLLAPSCGQYIFISSISAYGVSPAKGGDETTELAKVADPSKETMGERFENYGGFKAMCERAAEAAFPGRATIIRPGFIVGPGDSTDRFTYWPIRIQRGGDVLAPGTPDDPIQWIDVRDLGEWLITLAEHGTAGVFNGIGPNPPARWGEVLNACIDAAPGARLVWVPASWLETNLGEEGFPIWVPPVGEFAGFHRWSNARAVAAGFTQRPLAETVSALLDWFPKEIERRVEATRKLADEAKAKGAPPPPDPRALRAGITADKEQALLAKFQSSPR